MNKRTKIIIIAIITLFLVAVGVYLAAINNKNSDKVSVENSTLTKDNYYVEKGVEDYAKTARLGAEAYLSFDKDETPKSRTDRLKQYFKSDSPIFNNALDTNNLNTSAKVTSITSCEEQEGGDLCLIIMASLTIDNNQPIKKSYWMTMQTRTDGKFEVLDMGLWQ